MGWKDDKATNRGHGADEDKSKCYRWVQHAPIDSIEGPYVDGQGGTESSGYEKQSGDVGDDAGRVSRVGGVFDGSDGNLGGCECEEQEEECSKELPEHGDDVVPHRGAGGRCPIPEGFLGIFRHYE